MDTTNIGAGQLNEVAYFDTAPAHDFIAGASDGGDLDGDWANYPYFASGIVVTSNISKGLFVLKPRLTPTAVNVFSFSGRASGRRVVLSWRTGAELDTLGFDVWRSAAGNKALKVNRALVPAKAVGRAGGATYRVTDATARPGVRYTYRLRATSRDGKRSWRATTTVRVRS